MVPGADRDAPAVEIIRDFAVENSVDQEGQNARFFAGCTNQTQASDSLQSRRSVLQKCMFVSRKAGMPVSKR